MSNLNLPRMTYTNLSLTMGGRNHRQIAYATTLERVGPAIYVKHHSNVIAVLEPDQVYVTKCGWDSPTTANRLRTILHDNEIPYRVRIFKGEMRLDHLQRGYIGEFDRATFTRTASEWTRA